MVVKGLAKLFLGLLLIFGSLFLVESCEAAKHSAQEVKNGH